MSAIIQEEASFPRGGRDVLTALERKKLREKAERDAAAEVSKSNKATPSKKKGKSTPAKKAKSKQQKANTPAATPAAGASTVKVRGVQPITHKRLSTTATALGVIQELYDFRAIVHLANGLVGTLHLSDVSPYYTEFLRATAQEDEDGEGDEEPDDDNENENGKSDDVPTFRRIFYLGQQLVFNIKEVNKKDDGKRHISLTVNPSDINKDLPTSALVKDRLLSACVKSVEEHGYVLDIGLSSRTAFLSTKESKGLCKKLGLTKLVPGHPLLVHLLADATNRRAIKVGASPSKVTKAEYTDAEATWECMRAGLLVQATVKGHTRTGMAVEALGFRGSVHYFHVPDVASKLEDTLAKQFPAGSSVTARVLFADPPAHSMNLSLLPKHVSMDSILPPSLDADTRIGTTVEEAKVLWLDGKAGAVLDLGVHGKGFVQPSQVTDKKKEHPLKLLSPGGTHAARITATNPMDGVHAVSLQKSILKLPYLRCEDIPCGAVLDGTVHKLMDSGVVVNVTNGIRGLVPTMHLADVKVLRPEKKYFPGANVHCRVLDNTVTSRGKRRLVLTCKQTLVESDLPIIDEYSKAEKGAITHGFICAVRPYGCIVRLYNHVRGLVPLRELSSTEKISEPSLHFSEGRVVKCRVLDTAPAKGKLRLSFTHTALSMTQLKQQKETVGTLEAGQTVAVVVDSVKATGLRVHLKQNALVQTEIEAMHLTDHAALAEQMPSCFTEGQTLKAVVIWARNRNVTLSLKPSLLRQAKKQVLSDVEEVKVGDEHFGYVSKATRTMCFVNLIGSVSGMCPIKEVSSGYVRAVDSVLSPQQTVYARVHKCQDGKVDFSFAAAELTPELRQFYVKTYFEDVDRIAAAVGADVLKHKPGDVVRVTVSEVKDYGITVTTEDGCTGFIASAQAKGVALEVDKEVDAVVLDVDAAKNVLDLSVRPALVAGMKQGGTTDGDHGSGKRSKKDKKKGKKDKKKGKAEEAGPSLSENEEVDATIELVKEEYMVLSVAEKRLVFAACKTYTDRQSPFRKHFPGNAATVKVLQLGARTLVQLLSSGSKNKAGKANNASANKEDKSAGLSSVEDAKLGAIIKAKITALLPGQLNLKLKGGGRGRVHVTEIEAPQTKDENPVSQFQRGQVVECRVIGYRDAKNHNFLPLTHTNFKHTVLECSLLVSELSKKRKEVKPRMTTKDLRVGQKLDGVVQDVSRDSMWVVCTIHVRGRLSIFQAQTSDDKKPLNSLVDKFAVGNRVSVWVQRVEGDKVDLTLQPPSDDDTKSQPLDHVVTGRVKAKTPLHLVVALSNGDLGRVHVCDAADKFHADPFQAIHKWDMVNAKRVEMPQEEGKHSHKKNSKGRKQKQEDIKHQLSLRQSDIQTGSDSGSPRDPVFRHPSEVKQGQILRGYVKNVTDNGIYVALSRFVTARVQISNLSDLFVKDFTKVFKKGQLVKGRVLHVTEDGKIEFSLKRSAIASKASRPLRYEDLEVGQTVAGVVKRVESFGVFVAIDNSKLTGLAHISECADEKLANLDGVYNEGDVVKAKILRLNKEQRRISLGLKPSYFADEEGDEDEPKTKRAKRGQKAAAGKQANGKGAKATLADDEEEEAEEEAASDGGSGGEDEEEEGDSDEDDDDDDEYLDTTKAADKDGRLTIIRPKAGAEAAEEAAAAPTPAEDADLVGQSEGGYTDASDAAKAAALKGDVKPLSVEDDSVWTDNVDEAIDSLLFGGDESDEEEEDDEDDDLKDEPLSKRAKHAAKRQREAETRRKEHEKVAGKQEPKTPMDFDRLVLQAPNSSYAWIRYMAYYLQLTELDKARSVAKRALSTINFREEKERMNVWVALLNLENTYGSEATLNNVFTEACRQMEPERMHFHLVAIYERTHKMQEAEDLFKVMCKKFNKVQRVWLRYAEFKFKRGKSREARQVLERSLKSIPRPDHVDTIIKFGILEFKLGDVERGRTVFENVLSSYPKRVDLWSIYLDQEHRIGDEHVLRALYERVSTLGLSTKKMHFFFRRYLDFEKQHGDEKRVQSVMEKAREYLANKKAGDGAP